MKDLTMTREILLEKTAFIRGKFYSVEKEDHKKYLQHMKKYCAEIQRKSMVSLEKKLAESAEKVAKQTTDKVKCVAHVVER